MRPLSVKSKFAWFSLGFCALLGSALAGCGGGGGNGIGGGDMTAQWLAGACTVATGLGTISYSADWGAAPANASVVVQIVSSTNQVARTESFNRSAGQAVLQTNIASLPGGVYELRATLYSANNAGGTILGVASVPVNLCSGASPSATIQTSFGDAHASRSLFPTDISLQKNRTTRFLPTIKSSSGKAIFLQENGFTWTVGNGVGTIDAKGNFVATNPGAGAINATYTPTNSTIASPITVTAFTPTTTKWTVLVYMNAANDLYFASDLNVNQMEQVADNPEVRFVVQWKQSKAQFPASSFDGVRRVLVKPDNTSAVVSDVVQSNLTNGSGQALDFGNAQTLADFIKWGKENYPAERYCLIVWNHGNGWKRSKENDLGRAVSYDDQYNTSIKTWETDAMMGGEHVDILAWDASLMQMLEVAYEARNSATYVVGSEESPPAEGYPYHLVFDPFRDNPAAPTTELAKGFVDGMMNYTPYNSRKITQSVLESSKLDALALAVSDLGVALQTDSATVAPAIIFARQTAQAYSQTATRYYRDLIDLCQKINQDASSTANVKAKAQAVVTAAAAAIVYANHNSNSANSTGVAIDFSPGPVFTGSLDSDYKQLKFGQDFNWDEFLKVAP
jgi:hypothetical protein